MNRASIVCLLAVLVVLLPAPALHGQCDGPEYAGFDFWLGEWKIDQQFLDPAEGSWTELPARTSVRKILKGCALLERWNGEVVYPWAGMKEPTPLEGVSVRYWVPEAEQWKIQWMDSMRPSIGSGMVGTIANGYGEFEPEAKPENGRWSKIVFEKQDDDHVYWHLDHTPDGGESWVTIWKMLMTRE